MINIDLTKNIGLIYQQRSGATTVQHYLSEMTGFRNLAEFFNPITDVKLHKVDNTVQAVTNTNTDRRFLIKNIKSIADDRLEQLAAFNANELGVLKVHIAPFIYKYPEFVTKLLETNIQFIRVERADALYSILSHFIGYGTKRMHSDNVTEVKVTKRVKIAKSIIQIALKHYVTKKDCIDKYFKSTPVIYTEQFQQIPNNLPLLFTGLPEKTVLMPGDAFRSRIKDQVINIAEVENCYEQFVNRNKDYFPQYFDTSLNIPIVGTKIIAK